MSEVLQTADAKFSLEKLAACPICGAGRSVILYSGLTDTTFKAAPGDWTLRQCAECRTAYLDPRPDIATIHRAYETYYTHSASGPAHSLGHDSGLAKLRRLMVASYATARFGNWDTPAPTWLGRVVSRLPGIRTKLAARFRHLPRPEPGARLLDLGCGNGAFLHVAKRAGYEVVGVEPDPKAAEAGRQSGLDITTGASDALAHQSGDYDVITLNHVIEHLHDPVAVLRDCQRLLKPGGCIWIETPNIDAFGHKHFGAFWRGLEVPRHLVLFNDRSLRSALKQAGFANVSRLRRPSPARGMWQKSFNASRGHLEHDNAVLLAGEKISAQFYALLELVNPPRREFLTMTAKKPDL